MLTETAFAKINLALHVRARRADGFHEIESLFAFADHGDVLTADTRNDGTVALSIDGPFASGLTAGPDNLVLRAADALKRHHDVTLGANIRLTKNLPIASGIGGGSADAAAALRLLLRLWDVPRRSFPRKREPISPSGSTLRYETSWVPVFAGMTKEESNDLLDLAATLGSDVPACLVSRTLMGTGRGEVLDLRSIDGLAGAPLLLVNPRKGLSTASVFAHWDRQDRGPLVATALAGIIAEGRNDLQPSAIALLPEIADVLAALEQFDGLHLARMSGSGATCFALLTDEAALDRAARTLAEARPDWWIMTSRIR